MSLLNVKTKHVSEAVFGEKTDKNVLTVKIADNRAPHFLVIGGTGSGKSVFINYVLTSLMFHNSPEELKFIIVDPKLVEFSRYKGLPFMLCDPITNMEDAYAMLNWLCLESLRRNEIMAKYGVRNLDDYWELYDNYEDKKGEPRPEDMERFPLLIMVFDEYASALDIVGDKIENPLKFIGQYGRSSGEDIILATQRASADIVSSSIKANFAGRVALKTSSINDSNIILGDTGNFITADQLKGRGDGIYKDPESNFIRFQSGFIPDDQIEEIFKFLKEKYPNTEFLDYKQALIDSNDEKFGNWQWTEESEEEEDWNNRRIEQKNSGGFSF